MQQHDGTGNGVDGEVCILAGAEAPLSSAGAGDVAGKAVLARHSIGGLAA